MILPESTEEHAETVRRRIEAHLERWNEAGQLKDFELSLSIGVAQWKDGATIDETLDTADQKMYAIKNARPVGAS